MDEEDGGAVGAGSGGGVEEVVAVVAEEGVGGVDVGDAEGEVGKGGSGFIEEFGDGAGRREGGEELEKRGAGGRGEEGFMDLVGAKDLLFVQEGEAERLVGGDLGGELIRGDGQGEVMEAEEAGEGG